MSGFAATLLITLVGGLFVTIVGGLAKDYLMRRLDNGLDVRIGRVAMRLVRVVQGGLIGAAVGWAVASTWLTEMTWRTEPGISDQGSPLTEGAPIIAPEPIQVATGTHMTTTGLEVILLCAVAGLAIGALPSGKGAPPPAVRGR